MQNYRKHSKKIAVALIIILLCMVSLVSVTFALFTNGDDGKIGINVTSGKIKIDIIDPQGKSLKGDVLDFVGSDGSTKGDIIWEPGAVFYTEPFAIENQGDSPVEYRMYVECSDEDAKIVEVLEFFIVSTTDLKTKYPTRESLNSIDDLEELKEHKGRLEPQTVCADTYHLVVRMKADADNDYENLVVNGIGITVYAVQGNVSIDDVPIPTDTESDSEEETELSTESSNSETTEASTEITTE